MILMHLLVFHCLTMLIIEMYLVNLEPSLPLQTGLIVYTKMLGLDFSLGEQQQGRYIIVFIQFSEYNSNSSSYLNILSGSFLFFFIDILRGVNRLLYPELLKMLY